MIALKPAPYANDGQKWKAVLRHDARADDAFVFAVKTTGVYCRPSCRSRRARRENVVFHVSCKAAERAGFRACKRCQPDGPTAMEREAKLVARACRILESPDASPQLRDVARTVGLSPFYFHRLFTKTTGLTPTAYRTAHRAALTRQRLARRGKITDTIYAAGFSSAGRFYAHSARMLGMKPRAFQRGGDGETIRFALGKTSLGAILVAATEKGTCAISLGDDPDLLLRDLQERFPRARLIGGDRAFEKHVALIVGLVENPTAPVHLPLDIRGTAFQQKVWTALRNIPPGHTATYAQIARQIGHPKAIRAVGTACGANPLAVAIPCHRVVRLDGAPSGYRWGLDRKRALQRRESA